MSFKIEMSFGPIALCTALCASTSGLYAQTYDFTFTPGLGVSVAERIVEGQIVVVGNQIQSVTGVVYNRYNDTPSAYGTINGLLSPNSVPSGYPAVYGQPLSLLNDNIFNSTTPFLTPNGFGFSAGSGNFSYNLSALSGSPQQYALYSGGVTPGEMTFTLVSGGSESGPICFVRGSNIETEFGFVDIADLKTDDLVMTINGSRKIRWIGRMSFSRHEDGTFGENVYPVRILAGAFGVGLPVRDLLLSQAHSVFVDDRLIPIGNLVNGRSIYIERNIVGDKIDYYHLELDEHTAVFAEKLACETLQSSTQARKRFDNYHEYAMMYVGIQRADLKSFAPILGFNGGRSELISIIRETVSKLWDVRSPFEVVRDNVDQRAGITRSISSHFIELLKRVAQQRTSAMSEECVRFVRVLHNITHKTLSTLLSH